MYFNLYFILYLNSSIQKQLPYTVSLALELWWECENSTSYCIWIFIRSVEVVLFIQKHDVVCTTKLSHFSVKCSLLNDVINVVVYHTGELPFWQQPNSLH